MIQATALTLSALANVALLGLWLERSQQELVASDDVPLRSDAPTRAAADGVYARWRELGLDESDAKRLLFATLEADEVRAIRNPWERYWQSGDPIAEYALQLQDAYARVRRALENEFGTAARTSPEFSRAFRPLDLQFAFLSGAEQIELQQRRLRARDRSGTGASLDFLAPAAAFEVTLRDSPLAAQLRDSGVPLDEHEFREAFTLLARTAGTADLAAEAATRRQLRTLLGAERFAAVLAVRDPLFAVVARVGREHGLDAAALAAANEVLSEAQGQLLDLAATQLDGERAATGAAAILAAERERLAAAVGETVAAAILAAREEFYVGAVHEAVLRNVPAPE